jgi:hypothetical protein
MSENTENKQEVTAGAPPTEVIHILPNFVTKGITLIIQGPSANGSFQTGLILNIPQEQTQAYVNAIVDAQIRALKGAPEVPVTAPTETRDVTPTEETNAS